MKPQWTWVLPGPFFAMPHSGAPAMLAMAIIIIVTGAHKRGCNRRASSSASMAHGGASGSNGIRRDVIVVVGFTHGGFVNVTRSIEIYGHDRHADEDIGPDGARRERG
jgi:hypothetical protein